VATANKGERMNLLVRIFADLLALWLTIAKARERRREPPKSHDHIRP
jgi:hypothetical protein